MPMKDEAHVLHDADADYVYKLNGVREVTVVRCRSAARVINVPDYIDGRLVTRLGPASFSGLVHVAELQCPQLVRSIGAGAFRDCANLMAIGFPSEFDEFDVGWLEGCDRLRKVIFPGRASVVPAQLFERFDVRELRLGPGTRSVRVPHHHPICLDVLEIDNANPWLRMDGCGLYGAGGEEFLALIVQTTLGCGAHGPSGDDAAGSRPCFRVNDGCKRIGPYAFANQPGLVEVDLPDSLERIGEGAFSGSHELTRVTIPDSVVEIGPAAFAGARGISRLDVPVAVHEVGAGAFAAMPSLDRLVLPEAACVDAQEALASVADRPWETMAACDAAIQSLQDVDVRARLMIERLKEPLFLSRRAKAAFEALLADDMEALCRNIAEFGDYSLYEDLADIGLLDADAIIAVVESLSPRRHGEAIARLLRIKRDRFASAQPDYDI